MHVLEESEVRFDVYDVAWCLLKEVLGKSWGGMRHMDKEKDTTETPHPHFPALR